MTEITVTCIVCGRTERFPGEWFPGGWLCRRCVGGVRKALGIPEPNGYGDLTRSILTGHWLCNGVAVKCPECRGPVDGEPTDLCKKCLSGGSEDDGHIR